MSSAAPSLSTCSLRDTTTLETLAATATSPGTAAAPIEAPVEPAVPQNVLIEGKDPPSRVMTLRYEDLVENDRSTRPQTKQLPTNMMQCLDFVQHSPLVGGSIHEPVDLMKTVFLFSRERYVGGADFIVICYFAYTEERCPTPKFVLPAKYINGELTHGHIVGIRVYHFVELTNRSAFDLRKTGCDEHQFKKENTLRLSIIIHKTRMSTFDMLQFDYLQREAPYLKHLLFEACNPDLQGYADKGIYFNNDPQARKTAQVIYDAGGVQSAVDLTTQTFLEQYRKYHCSGNHLETKLTQYPTYMFTQWDFAEIKDPSADLLGSAYEDVPLIRYRCCPELNILCIDENEDAGLLIRTIGELLRKNKKQRLSCSFQKVSQAIFFKNLLSQREENHEAMVEPFFTEHKYNHYWQYTPEQAEQRARDFAYDMDEESHEDQVDRAYNDWHNKISDAGFVPETLKPSTGRTGALHGAHTDANMGLLTNIGFKQILPYIAAENNGQYTPCNITFWDMGCGAGNLLYICEQLKIRCKGVEKNEDYYELATKVVSTPGCVVNLCFFHDDFERVFEHDTQGDGSEYGSECQPVLFFHDTCFDQAKLWDIMHRFIFRRTTIISLSKAPLSNNRSRRAFGTHNFFLPHPAVYGPVEVRELQQIQLLPDALSHKRSSYIYIYSADIHDSQSIQVPEVIPVQEWPSKRTREQPVRYNGSNYPNALHNRKKPARKKQRRRKKPRNEDDEEEEVYTGAQFRESKAKRSEYTLLGRKSFDCAQSCIRTLCHALAIRARKKYKTEDLHVLYVGKQVEQKYKRRAKSGQIQLGDLAKFLLATAFDETDLKGPRLILQREPQPHENKISEQPGGAVGYALRKEGIFLLIVRPFGANNGINHCILYQKLGSGPTGSKRGMLFDPECKAKRHQVLHESDFQDNGKLYKALNDYMGGRTDIIATYRCCDAPSGSKHGFRADDTPLEQDYYTIL